ncbi:MAG: cytochrome c, partial [Chloroflexales bacterium]|nr:cytochrome c [Chloroflexales bacterium]
MTRNLVIATLFMLASALLLGFIWVAEREELSARAARVSGEQIAHGAYDYEQNCATCHGLTGEGISGPQINFLYVARQDASGTLVETGTLIEQNRWEGEDQIKSKYGTIRNYVESVISSGVRGTTMPAWSQQYGGPLREDQIRNIAVYVLGWQGSIPAGAQEAAKDYQEDIIAASVAASDDPLVIGESAFNGVCSACHNLNSEGSVGPGLGGLFGPEGTTVFGTQLPNGQDVTVESVREWITQGSVGFQDELIEPLLPYWGAGARTLMPPFPTLNEQQLNGLVAY